MQISSSQDKAIRHNKGAMLVLAGPGSGKTTVITRRTKELIETYGVSPEKILVITFTKAAAVEMKERFLKLCGRKATEVNFGTFHAVFFKIIKYAYSYNTANVLSEEEKYMYLRDLIYKLDLEVRDEKEFISQVSSEISMLKNSDTNIENYYSKNCAAEDFKKLYQGYTMRKNAENKIDFDDMLVICHRLLSERPDILAFWQSRYEYILIDEFQDINLLQYKTIKLLALPENNIFAVGDDDQSIYGFRGARPQIMLGFEHDYPGCVRVALDRNYRCPCGITELSQKLIGKNKTRFNKNVVADGKNEGSIGIYNFKTAADQNTFIAKKIAELVGGGSSLSDIAVLYRLNSEPGALLHKLGDYNIRYCLSDRLPDIFEHWIARDMFAYIALSLGSRRRSDYLQIANRPKRYISRDLFVKEEMTFIELERRASDKPYVIKALDRLRYDLDFMDGLDPFAAVNYIRKAVGYDRYLSEYAQYRGIDEQELFDVMEEFQQSIKGFANFDDLKDYVAEYREKLKSASAQQGRRGELPAVNLMTFHAAKGLEFETVIIMDANEGFSPYSKSGVSEDLEEERRMFYVAMTRAKKRLYILSSSERFARDLEVSRFVRELQSE